MRPSKPDLLTDEVFDSWSTQRPAPQGTYACKLVTPLYGGGVQAGEVDLNMPIRASAIRGQLRFWWRVVRRASHPQTPPRELFQDECAIFGGITATGPIASLVSVRLIQHETPRCEPAHRYERNPKKPGELKALPAVASWASGYALFPAQGKRSDDKRTVAEQPKALALPEVKFQLGFGFSEQLNASHRTEVETALRWWATFGGIGARTRRGLGAVLIESLAPISTAEVETAGGRLALGRAGSSATEAWKDAVELLRKFRQEVGVARNAGDEPNRPGRSLWPEADTLRVLSGNADPRHAVPLTTVRAFPRAAFGLPIVFQFKEKRDPDTHVLEPANPSADRVRDRMASQLILRPYWDGEHWQPSALLLPGWRNAIDQPLKFKEQAYTPQAWPGSGVAQAAQAANVNPMSGRGDDALSAFMDFFSKGGV